MPFLCNKAILLSLLADPEFQEAVNDYLKKLCEKFGDYKEECISTIQQYVPLVFVILEDYLRPLQLCAFVHMCPLPPTPPIDAR
jgi:hypothetical protein